jgi:hypothetical protein
MQIEGANQARYKWWEAMAFLFDNTIGSKAAATVFLWWPHCQI